MEISFCETMVLRDGSVFFLFSSLATIKYPSPATGIFLWALEIPCLEIAGLRHTWRRKGERVRASSSKAFGQMFGPLNSSEEDGCATSE